MSDDASRTKHRGKCGAMTSSLVPAARDAPRPLDLERLGAQRLAPLHQRLAHGPHFGALALAHFRVRVRLGVARPTLTDPDPNPNLAHGVDVEAVHPLE